MTEPESKPYEEEFPKRFVVEFQRLNFKLSAALSKEGEPIESAPEKAENVSHQIGEENPSTFHVHILFFWIVRHCLKIGSCTSCTQVVM